jgi:prolyl-tRNA editing enzyme YbaK/EbsC (Cys-tRNA(Pro) deacylase)
VSGPTALGALAWSPAVECSELLAAPVAAALRASPVPAYVAPIDPDLADTAAFCAAYDVPPEASANCVVVAGRRGEHTTLAACLVLAVDRADVNKTVRKHLDVRKISFAPMADAVAQTSMEYGGITPIGLPVGWPILVDEAVAAADWVVVGSGIRGSKIALPGRSVGELPGAVILPLAVRVQDAAG